MCSIYIASPLHIYSLHPTFTTYTCFIAYLYTRQRLYTIYCILYTKYYILYTIYYILYTLYYILLYTIYYIHLYTIYIYILYTTYKQYIDIYIYIHTLPVNSPKTLHILPINWTSSTYSCTNTAYLGLLLLGPPGGGTIWGGLWWSLIPFGSKYLLRKRVDP